MAQPSVKSAFCKCPFCKVDKKSCHFNSFNPLQDFWGKKPPPRSSFSM